MEEKKEKYTTDAIGIQVDDKTVYVRFKVRRVHIPNVGPMDTAELVKDEQVRMEAISILEAQENPNLAEIAEAKVGLILPALLARYIDAPGASSSAFDFVTDPGKASNSRKLESVLKSEAKYQKQVTELREQLAGLEDAGKLKAEIEALKTALEQANAKISELTPTTKEPAPKGANKK